MKYTKYFQIGMVRFVQHLFEECNHQTRNRDQFERYFEDHKT